MTGTSASRLRAGVTVTLLLALLSARSHSATSGTCPTQQCDNACKAETQSCRIMISGVDEPGTCRTEEICINEKDCTCLPDSKESKTVGKFSGKLLLSTALGQGGGAGVFQLPEPGEQIEVGLALDFDEIRPRLFEFIDPARFGCGESFPQGIPFEVNVTRGSVRVVVERGVEERQNILQVVQLVDSQFAADSLCLPCIGVTGENHLEITELVGFLDLETNELTLDGRSEITNALGTTNQVITTEFTASGEFNPVDLSIRLISVGFDSLPDAPPENHDTHCAFFLRGDCNIDGGLDIGDVVFQLTALFVDPTRFSCEIACDSNGDGRATGDLGDPIFSLNFNFRGGPQPADPFPDCGERRSEDLVLTCEIPAPDCDGGVGGVEDRQADGN